jgi:hypothetical protein
LTTNNNIQYMINEIEEEKVPLQLNMRVRPFLRKYLECQAELNGRSISKEVELRLLKSLEQDQEVGK